MKEGKRTSLRDSVTRFFASGFFHESPSPRPLKMTLGSYRIFSEIFLSQGAPPESTTPVKSTCQRCPTKIIKIFLIEDFFHLLPVSTTLVVHLELQISPQIFEQNLKQS